MKVKVDNTVTIVAKAKELEELLDTAEEKCMGAVEHVAAANWAGRDVEARASVAIAFSILRDNLIKED